MLYLIIQKSKFWLKLYGFEYCGVNLTHVTTIVLSQRHHLEDDGFIRQNILVKIL